MRVLTGFSVPYGTENLRYSVRKLHYVRTKYAQRVLGRVHQQLLGRQIISEIIFYKKLLLLVIN